jgi:hypothetical protein
MNIHQEASSGFFTTGGGVVFVQEKRRIRFFEAVNGQLDRSDNLKENAELPRSW